MAQHVNPSMTIPLRFESIEKVACEQHSKKKRKKRKVYLRQTRRGRKGHTLRKSGIVIEIDSRDPKRVRTDTCPGNFRKVLEICKRHSTSMISINTQSQSEHSISQYY